MISGWGKFTGEMGKFQPALTKSQANLSQMNGLGVMGQVDVTGLTRTNPARWRQERREDAYGRCLAGAIEAEGGHLPDQLVNMLHRGAVPHHGVRDWRDHCRVSRVPQFPGQLPLLDRPLDLREQQGEVKGFCSAWECLRGEEAVTCRSKSEPCKPLSTRVHA